MISKPLPAHSFYHTCRYILNKPGSEVLLAEGVRDYDFKLMAEDFIRQQQMRPNKKIACFHSVLSFHPSERLPDNKLMEVAQEYLRRLEITDTQFAICKHTDKKHLHLHVIANMVNNKGGVIPDNWIGLRGKKIVQQLTKEYDLIPAQGKDLKQTHQEALSESEATRYKIYEAISRHLPGCRTLDHLMNRLQKQGIITLIKYKGQTKEQQGISFKMGKYCFKGSKVDRKFSLAGLQKILAQQLSPEQNVGYEKDRLISDSSRIKGHTIRKNPESKPITPMLITDKEIDQGLSKSMEILFRSEDTYGATPYELTQSGYENAQRKKKRKRKR